MKKLINLEDVAFDVFYLDHSEKLDTVSSKIRGGFFTNSQTQTNDQISNTECNTDKIITKNVLIQAPADLCDTKIISKNDFASYDESALRKVVASLEVLFFINLEFIWCL